MGTGAGILQLFDVVLASPLYQVTVMVTVTPVSLAFKALAIESYQVSPLLYLFGLLATDPTLTVASMALLVALWQRVLSAAPLTFNY